MEMGDQMVEISDEEGGEGNSPLWNMRRFFFSLAVTRARIGTERWLCFRRTQKNTHTLFPRGEWEAITKFYVRT